MGRVVDTETGLIYLQARYYDPATAQFLTRDPLDALTGSAYGYVDDNPLNGTDPTGLVAPGGCHTIQQCNSTTFRQHDMWSHGSYAGFAVGAGVGAAVAAGVACVAGGCEAAAALVLEAEVSGSLTASSVGAFFEGWGFQEVAASAALTPLLAGVLFGIYGFFNTLYSAATGCSLPNGNKITSSGSNFLNDPSGQSQPVEPPASGGINKILPPGGDSSFPPPFGP